MSLSRPDMSNGHAFQEGSALGRLSAQGDRQIYLLELLHEQGEKLPDKIAERLHRPEAQDGITIRLRDIPGIVLGAMALIAAMSGKLSLSDVMNVVGKIGAGH